MRQTVLLTAVLLFVWISLSNAQLNSIKRLDGSAITPAAVDYTVTRLMKAANIPGLEIAIFNHGKVAYLKSYGLRETDKALPVTVNSVMSAASFTKVTLLIGGHPLRKIPMIASFSDEQFTFQDDLAMLSVVTPATYPLLGFGAAVHGKFVIFGVTRGWVAVASPLSSITWLISP